MGTSGGKMDCRVIFTGTVRADFAACAEQTFIRLGVSTEHCPDIYQAAVELGRAGKRKCLVIANPYTLASQNGAIVCLAKKFDAVCLCVIDEHNRSEQKVAQTLTAAGAQVISHAGRLEKIIKQTLQNAEPDKARAAAAPHKRRPDPAAELISEAELQALLERTDET